MKRIALFAVVASLITVPAPASVHGGGNPPPPRGVVAQSVHGGGNPHPNGRAAAIYGGRNLSHN